MTSRALLTALLLIGASPVFAQSVSLTLRDGRVTLITQNATPAAILAEWARQGQMKVVDAERVPATPLTLRLENVPEREALDIVLRGAAGYIAAPRALNLGGGVSRFDRVLVMASSPGAGTSTRPAAMGRAAAVPTPSMPVQQQQVAEEEATPAQAAEQAQLAQIDDTPAAAPSPEQPASSTNFDYANPQRYFAARQAEQQAAEAAQQQQAQQPSATPFGGALGQTSARPGVAPAQPQAVPGGSGSTPTNPYGLPADQAPGSSPVGSTLEPDRAKYINPYSPTPPRP